MLKHKLSNTIICSLLILYSFLTVLSAFLLTFSTDALINLDIRTFLFWTAIIVGLRFFLTWLDYFESVYRERTIQRMITDIRVDIVGEIGVLSYEEYEQVKSETYSSWLTNDMKRIQEDGFTSIYSVIDLGSQIIFATIALLYYSPLIMFSAFLLTIIMIYVPKKFNAVVTDKSKALSNQYESFLEQSNSIIGGFSIFYAFDQLNTMVKLIKKSSKDTEDAAVNLQKEKEKAFAIVNLIGFLGQVMIDLLTGILAIVGVVTVGSIRSTGNLSGKITFSLSNITNDFIEIQSCEVLLKKFNLFEKPINLNLTRDENKIINIETIEVNNLSYSFGGDVLFHNFDLKINQGEKIIITGRSGSGKSTFGKILAGYYRGYQGDIFINGKKQSNYSEKEYRENILYVEQIPYMFSANLKDNITLFNEIREDNLVNILNFLELEDVQTDVSKLSGGQKQRVHMARALAQGRKILILDEATSSLNKELQYKIERELFLRQDMTIIIITHHLDERIIPLADKIIDF